LPDWGEGIARSFFEALKDDTPRVGLVMDEAVQFHATLEVRRISARQSDGRYAEAGPADLLKAASPLLLNPVRANATALEEWVRGPRSQLDNIVGDEGLEGDVVVRTANTTVLVMPFTPNWSMLAHEEMVEFAASLPVLFLLWRRELEDVELGPDLDAMEESNLVERGLKLLDHARSVRHQLGVLHSPELIETSSHCGFLDRLYRAAGLPRLEEQLVTTINEVEAAHREVRAHLDRREAARRENDSIRDEKHRRRVELILAVLSGFSIAEFLGFLNGVVFAGRQPHPTVWVPELAVLALVGVLIIVMLHRTPTRAPTDEEPSVPPEMPVGSGA
jgi:hypothetical protein